jgi:hypothetical protein
MWRSAFWDSLATFLELIIVFFAIFPVRLVVAINRNPAPGGGGDKTTAAIATPLSTVWSRARLEDHCPFDRRCQTHMRYERWWRINRR